MSFIIVLEVLVAFSVLTVGLGFFGVYVIKPHYPDFWKRHICAPDPEERMFINSVQAVTPSVELMLSNSYNA